MEKKQAFGYSLHLNLYNCLGSIECFRKPGKDSDNGRMNLKKDLTFI